MYRLNEETRERLIAEAKKYNADGLKLFQAELGWEDWMNEFTDAAEGEEITEVESDEIDSITAEIFENAHKKLWYAVMRDENDEDWGTGSYDLAEAKQMVSEYPEGYIAVIEESDNPVCVEVIRWEE